MKEVFFLSFITLFVLAHTAVPPLQEALAGANLPPCTSKAYYFDIVGSKDKAFLFVVEMVPATKANWTMYMTRDNPETAFGFTSTCAIDTAVLKASDFPNPLIIEKSCGEVEGRWYVVVESDSGTTARFAFKDVQSKALTTMPNLAVAQDSKAGFTLAGTKDAPLPITNVLDRWDFYNISIPSDVPFGANILIEISTTVNAPLSTRLAYAGDRINSRCRSSRSFSKNLALPFCEIRQGGTWRLTVGRTVANQAYKVKAYLDRPPVIPLVAGQKVTYSLSSRFEIVYFSFSGPWPNGEASLIPVVDNVVGGEVALKANYDALPFSDCGSITAGCTTIRGCHVSIPPCKSIKSREKPWYAGVQASSLNAVGTPITFTFSWALYPVVPQTVDDFDPIIGTLRNGQLKHYFMPPQMYAVTGTWLRIHVYIDSTKLSQVSGFNGYLYLSNRRSPGPEGDGCSYSTKYCSVAQSKSDFMSCSLQLDPCELATKYAAGIYFSLIAVEPRDELWFQEDLSFTVTISADVVPSERVENSPFLLDTGDVVTGIVADSQYTFFRVPSHKGSVTIALSSPDYYKPPSDTVKTCLDYTIGGVTECLGFPECGWCNRTCVPCSGKVGGVTYCEAKNVYGCAATDAPPPPPGSVVPAHPVFDNCSPLNAAFCTAEGLSGVCGWCGSTSSCGSCVRNLATGADQWCPGQVPKNCETTRLVPSKRSVLQSTTNSTYKPLQLQLIISYDAAYQGPSCECWKPHAIIDVYEGETVKYTLDACRADSKKALYVGVYGAITTNFTTPWLCILDYTSPIRLNTQGDVECMSLDGKNCLSGAVCETTIATVNSSKILPVTCGEYFRKQFGFTGYDTPSHWCARSLGFFDERYHSYAENPYTISVKEYTDIPLSLISLKPKTSHERAIGGGDTHYIKLDFNRTNVVRKLLSVKIRGHPGSAITATLGFLEGDPTDGGKCYRFAAQTKHCTFTEANGGLCLLKWGRCDWTDDGDARPFVVSLHRSGTQPAKLNDATDLYNVYYEIITETERVLQLGQVVPDILSDGLYHYFNFTVPKNTTKGLVIEAYFDAGHQLSSDESIQVYMNTPTQQYLAGDITDCHCSQEIYSDPQKVLVLLDECDVVGGTYHLAVKATQRVTDTFGAKYTITVYQRDPVKRLAWDVPTDHSSFVNQRTRFQFEIPNSLVEGKINPNTTITLSLSTYFKDIAILTLHKGNESACGCNYPVSECTTVVPTVGRPSCKLQVDWCMLEGAGEYFLTVTPRNSTDRYTAMTYTLFASQLSGLTPIVKLTPTTEDCLSPSSITSHRLDNLRTQHYEIEYNRVVSPEEVLEVYITNLRAGTLTVSANDVGLATSQCRATNTIRCTVDEKFCIVQLACPKRINYISVYARSLENNEPVTYSISSCFTKPTKVALGATALPISVPIGGTRSLDVSFANVSLAETPTIALRFQQTDASLPYDVTLDQGQCSGCSSFHRQIECGGGVCWLYLHWFELPSNWQSKRWIAHVDNEATAALSISVQVLAINMGTPTILTTNTPSPATVGSASWRLFRWSVTAAEAAKDKGIRTGTVMVQLTLPAPVPDSATDHKVYFGVTKSRLGVNEKLALQPAKGGAGSTDTGLYTIALCCITEGDFFVYVWNGHPTTTYTFSVTPTLKFVTNNVNANFGESTKISVPRGSAITNVAIPFSGLTTTDPGSRITVEITGTGADPASSTIYFNFGGASGPRTSCTWNIEQAGGLTYARDWYSCAAKPLEPTIYWFGLVAGSVDRDYTITIGQLNPVVVPIVFEPSDVWSSLVRSSPLRFHQFRFDLQREHKTFGVQLVAQVEIDTDSIGSVTLLWNLDQPADSPRDCAGNRGQVIASRTSPTSHTAGKIALPSCVEKASTVYLGIRPDCVAGDCSNVLNNPRYKVRIVARQSYPDTSIRILPSTNRRVTEQQPGADYLFVHDSGQIYSPTQYLRLLVDNIQWKSTKGTISIDWIQDGSCNLHTDDDDCNTAQTACAAIVFPCEYVANNTIKFRVSVTHTVSYVATLDLLGNNSITTVNVGEERKVTVQEEALALFRVDLKNNLTLVGPGDKVVIKLSDVGCGSVKAWINRGYGAGPGCNLALPCTTKGCVLWEASACNLMTKDNGGEFFVTVRGLDRFTDTDISVRIQVAVIPDGEAPTTFVTVHDNEEHKFFARVLKPQLTDAEQCSTEALPQFSECCSTKSLLGNNDTRHWVPDDTHFVYTVEGGHHFGYGAVITVGVREQVERATVLFSPDYPFFCGTLSTQKSCIATRSDPCVFKVDSCIRSTRQIYIWVNPDTVKWAGGRLTLAPREQIYQVGYLRVDNKQISSFDVAPTTRLPTEYHPQFHPFWLLPGEFEYIQISHPANYDTERNYHVRVEIEEIFGGVAEIVQNNAWTPCVDGECQIYECLTSPNLDQCVVKYGPCRCENFEPIDIPPCFDTSLIGNVEQYDDDKADHLIIRALGSGTTEASAVRGRVRFTFFELEEDINVKRCEVVQTGRTRFFNPKIAPRPDQLYKFSIYDMEQDYGGVRLSVNDNKVALPGVVCAEKAFCFADGDSCSILYRREASTAPRVSVKGDGTGRKYFGDHHFFLDASLFTVDLVELSAGNVSVSPTFRATADENCLRPTAPEFYRFRTNGRSDFIVVRLVAHNARAWIHEGHVTYGWGKWVCDGRKTSGICETVIACEFNKTGTYYIHVEGSSHQITVYEHNIETRDVSFGNTTVVNRFSSAPYYAVRITDIHTKQDDPMKNMRVKVTGQILESWLTIDKFGDKTCRIPQSSDVLLSGALYGQTFVHNVPACHLPTYDRTSSPVVVNVLRKFHRSGDAVCVNYDFSVTSDFVPALDTQNNFMGVGASPYLVKPNADGVAKAVHKIVVGAMGDDDVVYTRVTRSNVPVNHVVWKSNYVREPMNDFCSRNCFSPAQTNRASWLDVCWHCGGASYDTVFVEVSAKDKSDTILLYDIEVSLRYWADILSSWTTHQLKGATRDHQFFKHARFDKTVGNAFEIMVLSGVGVEVEVFPADCHRREGSMDLQPIVYRCFPGQLCDISFPNKVNFGSKSTKESRIWSDDSLRIVVKGYNTEFQIRTRIKRELCRAAPAVTLTPYCYDHLRQQTPVWGTSDVMWGAQDLWATSFAETLMRQFDCPADQKCQCKPITDFCRQKIRAFACEFAFGTCSLEGFRRNPRLTYCSEVEGACGRTFGSVGLGWLDCRHAFYDGQKLLTREDGCDVIEGCPTIKPPTPSPAPKPPTPPRPPVGPEPTPVEIEDTGLTLAAKLGIGLAFLALAILIALIFYFGVVSPRMAFRNTIEGEGYEIM